MCRTNKIAGQEKENMSEKMIGCLCWFNNYREIVVGILREIQTSPNGETCYLDDKGCFYPECQPVKPDEVKFYDLTLDGLEIFYTLLEKKNDRINTLEEENKNYKEILQTFNNRRG